MSSREWRTNRRTKARFPMSTTGTFFEAVDYNPELAPRGIRLTGMRKIHGESDPVIFRKWPDGSIIAILPYNTAGRGMAMMYEHIGQHGEGSPDVVMSRTTRATPEEYDALLHELINIGYSPVVRASEELEMLLNEREKVE